MPKPYSMDLRLRVIAACDAGDRPEDVGPVFGLSPRTIYGWLALREQTGSLEPRPCDPGPEPLLAPHREQVLRLLREHPDATLEELRTQTPVKVCVGAMWNFLQSLGITRKKESHSRRRTASARRARAS
jgi:transposase